MRMVTIWGPFKEVDVEEYAHTPHSLAYQIPQLKGVFKLLYAFQTQNRPLFGLARITADRDLKHTHTHNSLRPEVSSLEGTYTLFDLSTAYILS